MDYWVEGKDHVNSDAVFRPYARNGGGRARKKVPCRVLSDVGGKNAPEDQPALITLTAGGRGYSIHARIGRCRPGMLFDMISPQIGLFYRGARVTSLGGGSYLAACVLYAAVFGQTPIGLPSKITGTPVNLDY